MRLTATALLLLAWLQPQEAGFENMSDEERRGWIIDQAATYEIRSEEAPQKLSREEPVLRFNDNVTGVVDAILFVWTRDARPEAAASFWYRKDGLQAHEFVSLSRGEVEAMRDNSLVWNPAEAGVQFKPIPSAPAPAETAVRRLVQMRQLAKRFAASVKSRSGDLRLRLMPQPMIRYAPQDSGTIDGAVFSFSKGTNPEVLLLVEAIEDKSDGVRYVYSPARMTSRACRLLLDEESVWSVKQERGDVLSGTYRNFYTRE
jgi:hypothetical protein